MGLVKAEEGLVLETGVNFNLPFLLLHKITKDMTSYETAVGLLWSLHRPCNEAFCCTDMCKFFFFNFGRNSKYSLL